MQSAGRQTETEDRRSLASERALVLILALCAGWMAFANASVEPPSTAATRAVGIATRAESRAAGLAEMTQHVESRLAASNPLLARRERARIAAAVIRYSGQYDLDPELVTAVILVESNARPWARSPKGAIGLMQVMPHMMGPLELAGNAATIESNVEAGCRILGDNIRRLGLDDGVSAYFWGSDIRGVAYLEKVRDKLESIRRARTS